MTAGGSALDRLGWYARRLRSMQAREVIWRLQQATRKPPSTFGTGFTERQWAESLEDFRSGRGRPVLLDRDRAAAIGEAAPDFVAPLLESADRFVENRFHFFGYPPVTLTRPIQWHHDPISDVSWPDAPSNRIDHRVAGGDVKWIWELNRLQHLPLLAQGWLFTGDSKYSSAAFEHLDSWIDQNPPGRGIAWRGAFEAGMRSISIAVALQGLRDAPELNTERYRRVVSVLAVSAERCWRERSRFSSANNHLIGEMTGLAVIAMLFTDLPGAQRWEQRAVQTLSTEASNLILQDGCGAEQSVAYQIATVELLQLIAALLLDRDGRAPEAITDAVTRSSVFLADVVGEYDPDPRYGDADQEFALRLGPEDERTVRQHLGIAASLGLHRGARIRHDRTLAAQWYRKMLPNPTTAGSAESDVQNPASNLVAADGGLVVLRRGRRRITMDVGPLGYLSIAAHGHADALAVTVSDDGQDVIGDPGTGSYYRHPQWRAVMRGTRAHATVCVDGQDQSVIGGPFLWSRHANARVRGIDLEAGVVDAEHDGYLRLPGRVIHRRWLIAPPEDRTLLVVDLISGRGIHEARTTWPLHPALGASSAESRHLITRDETPVFEVHHAATSPIALDGSFGDDEHTLGWWSDLLETRTPAWWLSAVCNGELPVAIATLLCPADGVVTSGLSATLNGDGIAVTWTEGRIKRGKSIRIDAPAAVEQWSG